MGKRAIFPVITLSQVLREFSAKLCLVFLNMIQSFDFVMSKIA